MSRSFSENLADFPSVEDLAGIELTALNGTVTRLENKAGSQGSLRLYRHLLAKFGAIDAAAAAAGLVLYAEHTPDARLNPGKHPNIDRLLAIESGGPPFTARLLPARP